MILRTAPRWRRLTFLSCATALLTLALTSGLWAQELGLPIEANMIETALGDLRAEFPEVQVDRDQLGRTFLYGAPMVSDSDRDRAVELWLDRFSLALGAHPSEFELFDVSDLSSKRGTVYAYRLWKGAVPIEGGSARILVRPLEEGRFAVAYAAAHTALTPESGYSPVLISAERAEAIALFQLPQFSGNLSAPQLVITPSATTRDVSLLAWHVRAHEPHTHSHTADHNHGAWTVLIDPVNGEVLEVRNELIDVDVEGQVRAPVTPDNEPDTVTNPPVEIPLEGVTVSIVGGASTLSAADGTFTIPHGGTAPVTVQASLFGDWVTVNDASAPNFILNQSVTPPGPATLTFSPIDALQQAQLNAFHYTTLTHDFLRDRAGTALPGIDSSITCNVNLNDICNAFYDPFAQSINFFLEGGGCVNTSYSSVVSHEYGHFVVNQLSLAQGAFGEGYGDCVSIMMFDDPIIGRDFQGPGTAVRDPAGANLQYPCSGAIHFCGQLLGGTWWDIRQELGVLTDPATGLVEAQQLFVDWSLLTLGGQGDSSAHPQTAIEVLTVDDDDASISNGTPRFATLCTAFSLHSIDCPTPPPLTISFPIGRPTEVTPGVAAEVRVQVVNGTQTVDPNSIELAVRGVGQAAFTSIPMAPVGNDQYVASIPPQACGGVVAYFIRASDTVGTIFTEPTAGSNGPFEAPSFESVEVAIEDQMETDLGWTVGAPGDTATTGIWTRVEPIGTAAAPGSDHSDPGSFCWVTGQGTPGGTLGENDVDGGFTTLISPVLDLSAAGEYTMRYWRWFSNDTGAEPNTEVLTIDLSNDGGLTWSNVEVVGPFGAEASGGWFLHEFAVSGILPPTANMRLRFVTGDPAPGSLVEAAIDDLEVLRLSCGTPTGPQYRRGDVSGDGIVGLGDAVNQLGYLFQGGSIPCLDAADANDDGSISLGDVVYILSFLFAGGPDFPAPWPDCGEDSSAGDALDCIQTPASCP